MAAVDREAIAEAIADREHEMVEFLREFVAIDAENPPGRRYTDSVDFLADAMDGLGYDVERVGVPDEVVAEHYPGRAGYDRENVLGRRGSGNGPDVHFTGHFDVVPAGEDWSHDPYTPTVEDGRLYGRGSSDMKSGIAASPFAAEALAALDAVEGTITQSMTCDEETGGFTGLGYLVEEGYLTRGTPTTASTRSVSTPRESVSATAASSSSGSSPTAHRPTAVWPTTARTPSPR